MSEILDDYSVIPDGDEETKLIHFFEKNSDYYLAKWKEFKTGKFYTFNLMAFLFGIMWFLYRKMYKEAGILSLIIIVETCVSLYFIGDQSELSKTYDYVMQAVYAIVTGFVGNYLYMRSTQRKLSMVDSFNYQGDSLEAHLRKVGGTSWLAVIVGVLIFIVLLAIIMFFTDPSFEY